MYAFLFHLLHSKEDAEEIVQETFIKIWEKREDFIEGYSFDSFLFTVAKNAFLNLNRKKINRKVFEDHLNFLDEISSGRADDYVIFKETKEIINTIIEGLPPKRKEIFFLRKIEGLSRKEIAEKLDISIITVDSQLMKANIYLKDQFKKYKPVTSYFVSELRNKPHCLSDTTFLKKFSNLSNSKYLFMCITFKQT